MGSDKKVAIALSGGIDSSVSAFLLKEQGYEVTGITAKMVDDENFEQVCQNAANVAGKIGIQHHIIDLSKEFRLNVIDYFENSYKKGTTPNPCIVCNKTIKWGELYKYSLDKLKADYIATGHYAKIVEKSGKYLLYPAKDSFKDQLYYLFELSQEQLSRTLFPISHLTKDEVREIANKHNLPSKSSKESQDICFIKKPMTTKKYIMDKFKPIKGKFIHSITDQALGYHEGFYQYTIGQRKGIGISYPEPLYVAEIDPKNNIVYLGTKNDILHKKVTLNNINWQDGNYGESFEAMVKIRYNMQAQKAQITKKDDFVEVNFETDISAPAKGQAGVIYDHLDGHLIAGGWII